MQHISGGDPFTEEAYSLNQAAAALGKSQLTFKRWVAIGIVPEPVYIDTSYKYQQYLGWEIEAIIEPIANHFDKFDYLLATHEDTIGEIWSALNHARVERGRHHGSKKEK